MECTVGISRKAKDQGSGARCSLVFAVERAPGLPSAAWGDRAWVDEGEIEGAPENAARVDCPDWSCWR
eukprot:6423316-Alexandrium_andersonii.AAC.1